MAYRSDVPISSHQVRGVSGDLVAMRENFQVLEPVATSGLHGLISGGTATSGSVPVLSGTGTAAPWVYRLFQLGNLLDVAVTGAVSGAALVLSGATWIARLLSLDDLSDVSTAGAVSGQGLQYNGSSWVPGTFATSAGSGGGNLVGEITLRMVSGNTQALASGAHTVITGMELASSSGSWAYDAASGVVEVPSGATHVRLIGSILISGAAGDREAGFRINGSDQDPSGITTEWNQFVVTSGFAAHVVSRLVPVTSGMSLAMYAHPALAATALWGISGGTEAGYQTWFQVEAINMSGSTGAGGSGAGGFYQCVLVMPSGNTQSCDNTVSTQISGCNSQVMNTGGFTTGSGTITVPAGSGYTHVEMLAAIAWPINATGVREVHVRKNGGNVISGIAGEALAAFFNRCAANPTAGQGTNIQVNTFLIPVSGGEVFSIWGQQGSGGALVISGGGANNTYFSLRAYKLVSG